MTDRPVYITAETEMTFKQPAPVRSVLLSEPEDGIRPSLQEDGDWQYEAVMGIDFGTSSAKVVVQDGSRSFAIPFRDAAGINAYLLPTMLWESPDGAFNLDGRGRGIGSLKVRLIQNPTEDVQTEAAAYLAFVIRLTRAYLFTVQHDQWELGDIFWHVLVGLPSTQSFGDMKDCWVRILKAAWKAAGTDEELTRSSIRTLLRDADRPEDEQMDLRALPECSALIYAAYKSGERESRPMNFITVDVGSATVDVSSFCIFNRFDEGERHTDYTISLHTASVEMLGTSFCHANRIRWWIDFIEHDAEGSSFDKKRLCDALQRNAVLNPETLLPGGCTTEYVSADIGSRSNADAGFFPALQQLTADVKKSVWQGNKMSKTELETLEIYVCGGGSRCSAYARWLRDAYHPNISLWTNEHVKLMVLLNQVTFDRDRPVAVDDQQRLAVAFGLASNAVEEVVMTEAEDRPVQIVSADLPEVVDKDKV